MIVCDKLKGESIFLTGAFPMRTKKYQITTIRYIKIAANYAALILINCVT